MKLSACIVVYNGYDEALKAAQTVLHCTRRYPVTLYLVDNASPDGSGKKLEQAVADGLLAAGPGQQVVVHCRTENGGFGTGHNMILPELDSDFHFILNPDIQLTADTLSDLADWMAAHPDAVMALSLIHISEPSSCPCAGAPCGPCSTASCPGSASGKARTTTT